jgi:hypothetical protein
MWVRISPNRRRTSAGDATAVNAKRRPLLVSKGTYEPGLCHADPERQSQGRRPPDTVLMWLSKRLPCAGSVMVGPGLPPIARRLSSSLAFVAFAIVQGAERYYAVASWKIVESTSRAFEPSPFSWS